MCMLSHFSHVQLWVTLWAVAHQAPLSTGFSRQEYWSGLPFSSLLHTYRWIWRWASAWFIYFSPFIMQGFKIHKSREYSIGNSCAPITYSRSVMINSWPILCPLYLLPSPSLSCLERNPRHLIILSISIAEFSPVLCDNLGGWDGGLGGRSQREGPCVCVWSLIHCVVGQRSTQHYKAVILQPKINLEMLQCL